MEREKTMYGSVLVLEFMSWNFNQLALIYMQYWYISNIRNQINFESVKAALMMKNSFAGGKMLHLFSFYQEIQDSVAMALRNDKRYNFAYKIEITWDAYDQGPNKGAISWQAARVYFVQNRLIYSKIVPPLFRRKLWGQWLHWTLVKYTQVIYHTGTSKAFRYAYDWWS